MDDVSQNGKPKDKHGASHEGADAKPQKAHEDTNKANQ
jgi:hypothetical protein